MSGSVSEATAPGISQLWLGRAKVDITPPAGTELSGFIARVEAMTGCHDNLYARALVWSETGTLADAVALVVLDVVDLNHETIAAIRAWATAQCGIPGERIGVACTHTHGGPATLAERWLGHVDPAYLDLLGRLVGGAIAQATLHLEPVMMHFAVGHEVTVGRNRRVPGGIIDPQVPVLRFQRADGSVAAMLVNYACHPVTLGPRNLLATADYPGYTMRTLEAIYPGALALFVTGCCGQINTGHTARDGLAGRGLEWRSYGEAERLGRAIAAAATLASEQAMREGVAQSVAERPYSPAAVDTVRRTITLPLLPAVSSDERRRLTQEWQVECDRLARDGGPHGARERYLVWLAWAAALEAGDLPTTVDAEVMTIRLGDVALILLPGEMFVEFGLAIKERAAPRQVITIAYVNGTPGYIPHRSAYPAGGYEVEEAYRYYGYPACFAPEAGERLVETALELLAV